MWAFTERQRLAACVLILAFAAGGIILVARRATSPPVVVYPHPVAENVSGIESVGQSTGGEPDADSEPEEKPGELVVHVCGAVKNPGIYTLTKDARVADAVGLAGGLADEAIEEAVNMAMKLTDSMQIYIPGTSHQSVAAIENMSVAARTSDTGKVNINTATASQLRELPGIGPALAERIIDYRTSAGKFERVEDLMKVSGIGEKKYADLKSLVTVY